MGFFSRFFRDLKTRRIVRHARHVGSESFVRLCKAFPEELQPAAADLDRWEFFVVVAATDATARLGPKIEGEDANIDYICKLCEALEEWHPQAGHALLDLNKFVTRNVSDDVLPYVLVGLWVLQNTGVTCPPVEEDTRVDPEDLTVAEGIGVYLGHHAEQFWGIR